MLSCPLPTEGIKKSLKQLKQTLVSADMYYYTFSVDERVFLLLVYFLQAGVVHLWRGGTSHPESVLSAVLLLSHALKFIFLIT